MDAKEIKSALKEAREDIKNKDFKSALKICKNILKADRNNYVGLVLFGVALQETDQKDQAPNAFKKAIDVSPKLILAWQGLASFYEKEKCENSNKELINVYIQLLNLESDLNKFSDVCSKLVPVAVSIENDIENCVSALEQQESLCTGEQKQVIWKTIVDILGQIKDLSPKLLESMEVALEKLLNESREDNEEYFKKYLKLLYKLKKLIKLVEKAKAMHISYPKSEYPLEWICRAYSEHVTVIGSGRELNIDIYEFCDKLSLLNKNSSMVILAKGTKLYEGGLYLESIDTLKQVVSVMPSSVYLWALLCQCYVKIHCYMDSEHCAAEALMLLKKQNNSNDSLLTFLRMLHIRSLCYQTDPEKVSLAIEKCKEFLSIDHGNLDVVACLTRLYLASDDVESTQKCISVLEEQENYQHIALLLTALKLKKGGMIYRAIEVLNTAISTFPNFSEIFLELGKLQWDEKKYDIAMTSFLKAAKLDPNNYECFVYLGKLYSLLGRDLDKARRCYQKAFQLNMRNDEAGYGLSDIYRIQKNVELNVQLLTYVTQQAGPGGAKWAWLRLGLYHHEKGSQQEAIDSLRAAVRCDPTDGHCWESLADAYFAKGSYTSALKSYQRVVELNPQALYSAYQVASLKQLIGQHEEAAAEYKTVVSANPKYVPALKGLGETCLLVARSHLKRQLLGLCRDVCQEAVDALTVAAEEHRNLSCLWKLLGDVCTLMADLPESRAFLTVQRWLLLSSPKNEEENKGTDLLQKEQVLQLGARCYCRSLSIASNSLLWQDLAVNYHCQANHASSPHVKKQLREWALVAAKQCVKLNPKIWQHWNMVGVVAVSPEINNLKLGQHAFIKSIQIEDSKNAMAWTNLGTIYLKLGEIKLANAAYRAAQNADYSYVQCWIGQAMIAESIKHDDTMDLFRHTTSLAVHPESCLGYAQWVCSTLLHSENKYDLAYIKDMYGVPVAGDCMIWYTGLISNSACAYNLLGLLMERMRLYNTSADAFGKALKTLEREKGKNVTALMDKVRCNYGRVLVQLQRYEEAIQQYLDIKEASCDSQCGLALAYFKAEMYEESYKAYETTLCWFAPDDGLKSHILVAMAAMAYKFQGVDDSKTLLFQCAQLKPPSVQGLFACCSLGIIHEDLNLSELVLKELVPYQSDPNYITHIAVFKAYICYLQNRRKEAVRCLSSPTHKYPGQASLWLALALLLLNMYPNCDAISATSCAQIAMFLGQSNMDVSKVMSLVTLGHLFSGKAIQSLRSSQKAVHMFPHIPENWVVVIASFLPWCVHYKSLADALWLKQLIGHVRRKMDATRQMAKWLSKHEHKVTSLSEEFSQKFD